MLSSVMAPISSSSSATVRVDKATSEFLMGPDWTMNIDICDNINSNQMLAKDVVKAVKKRLQHKNPKVQLLALTLLETMVKNCGQYVHLQIAERNILQEMVKIVKKRTDMHVRDKIVTLIGSWHEVFGGSAGRYPQYYMAYEDLRRIGVQFPRGPPDGAPIPTPPITGHPQPGYGIPSTPSSSLNEVMLSDNFSVSNLNSMRDVVDLLNDMLQAVDPRNPTAVKDELIVDLVEQCRANQRKLMQTLTTTGDEEILGHGLELNDSLQNVLERHDAIASGSPLPPQVINVRPAAEVEKHGSNLNKPAQVIIPNTKSNSDTSSHRGPIDEDEEEEDDFAQLARRHSKAPIDASHSTSSSNGSVPTTSISSNDVPTSEALTNPVTSNALVPINTVASSKDQDMTDLLSMTLSISPPTEQTYDTTPISHVNSIPQSQTPLTSQAMTSSSEAYPGNPSSGFNTYVAPWARVEPDAQPQPPAMQPQYPQFSSGYPAPPWAASPGYFSNLAPVTRPPYMYSAPRPASSMPTPLQHVGPVNGPINGETRVGTTPLPPAPPNAGQKPFIPSYRLFEDLDVFGNAAVRPKADLLGSNYSMGGRK